MLYCIVSGFAVRPSVSVHFLVDLVLILLSVVKNFLSLRKPGSLLFCPDPWMVRPWFNRIEGNLLPTHLKNVTVLNFPLGTLTMDL